MPHPVDIEVGKRIRKLRLMRGLTQLKLGEMVDVKFQQIQKYETGMNRVSASRLYEIANTLRVDPSYFFPKPEGTADHGQDIFTKEHVELIKSYDALLPEQQANLIATARVMNPQVAA